MTTITTQAPAPATTTKSAHAAPVHGIQMASEVELAGLSFSPMKTSENGRKSVYVNNINGGKFQLETPWLTSYRGVSQPPPMYADPAYPKYSLRCSLDCSNPETKDFVDLMLRFERHLIKAGASNSMEWFKRKALSEDVIEQAMFTKIIKPYVDKESGEVSDKYPSSIDFKVPYYDGEWGCQFYNADAQHEITEDVETRVTGRMKVRAIIECCPMWFMAGNKYGCKWKVSQVEYKSLSTSRNFEEYAFDTSVPLNIPMSELAFTDVKVNDKTNTKAVYINHNSGALLIQTPWMTSYNGIALPPPEYADVNNPRYSIQWSLQGHNGSNPEVSAFAAFMLALDQRILEEAKEHCFEWFKRKAMSMDVLKSAMFTPTVKFREDKETGEQLLDQPPSFKASVPYYDDQWKCAVFNELKERTTESLDSVAGGKIQARAILQCKGLWFIGGRFGCGWKLVQMEYKNQTSLSSPVQYAFRTPSVPIVSTAQHDGVFTESEEDCVDSDME